jgi:DNA replication and repair protein RecF
VKRDGIRRIQLSDFRSFEHLALEFDRPLTVLVGHNGSGKTNLIEAVQLVTAASSFRKPSWGDLVRWSGQEAVVRMEAAKEGGGERFVEMRVNESGRRSYRLDGKAVRRAADVRGVLPAVLFSPDDLRMVKDAPERRRAAVDEVGGQLSLAYALLKIEYEEALRQRNALLREEAPDAVELELWTERLSETGGRFAARRIALFDRLARRAEASYPQIAGGETLRARYVPSWGSGTAKEAEAIAAELKMALGSRIQEERARRVTPVGPHRDDIAFEVEGRDARAFGSQGQQRSVALAWKIGEVQTIQEIGRGDPVLLLDDVMSELDESRRGQLADLVGVTAQTIVTTTDLSHFSGALLADAKTVRLE